MKIKPIFVNNELEGLHAIVYDGMHDDEFERLFSIWNDTQYLSNYLLQNIDYLKTEFFKGLALDDILNQILDEAENLEELLEEHAATGSIKELQMLFKPLDDREYVLRPMQESKAKDKRKRRLGPILRIYAIRIDEHTYIVTGGAIKLGHYMDEHNDTDVEIDKLRKVKLFLRGEDINCLDDLNMYYDEQA